MKIGLIGLAKTGKTTLFNLLTGSAVATRAFPDEVAGLSDPRRDILDLETELILADLEVVDRRLERLEASLRKQRKEVEAREQEILRRLKADLETEIPLRAMALSPEEAKAIRGFTFLSEKPILHCLNLDEKALADGPRVGEKYG